jgi:mannose-1-phosphate guanylyltransferase/mannose-6-phosphate isomerase
VEGLAVVDTADAVLVAPIERAQEIKGLVAELEAAGHPEARTPARVHRPWGWYQTMDLGERFRVKRIVVLPGKRFSLQKHHHRAEHWVVVRGTAEVVRDDETLLLRENESVYLPLGCVHRLSNPGRIPVEIVEVQTGAYLEEDDIVRFEDDYGRS